MAVKNAIDENKTQTIHKRIADSNGDQKKLFNIIKTLLGRQKKLVLPDYSDPITLASTFNMYFIDKIANIRAEFPLLESSLSPYSFGSMDYIMPTCANLFDRFTMITSEELTMIVSVMNKTTCSSDPFPSKLLMSHLPTIIDTIMHIINLCLSTSVFLSSCKSDVVLPLIKKPGLDPQVFKNYRPVSNLSFLKRLLKRLFPPASSNTLLITNLLINFSLHIGVVTVRKLICYVFITILLLWLERATGHIWLY